MKRLFLFIFVFFVSFAQFTLASDKTTNSESYILSDNIQESEKVFEHLDYKPSFIKMFLILAALIVLIFLTFYLFRKLSRMKLTQANLTKSIKILEKRALSPKSILYIVEADGKKVLIAESNLEVRKLKDMD
jgi:flagellar biogenesis protein FliO